MPAERSSRRSYGKGANKLGLRWYKVHTHTHTHTEREREREREIEIEREIHKRARAHTRARTHARARTHTHTHTHTHAHTRTHTQEARFSFIASEVDDAHGSKLQRLQEELEMAQRACVQVSGSISIVSQ